MDYIQNEGSCATIQIQQLEVHLKHRRGVASIYLGVTTNAEGEGICTYRVVWSKDVVATEVDG
jgi:hypothetical protein